MRVGMGYDVHKLVEGRDLILGGVKVPHTLGLLGHSDADVLIHALMDALLGAAAMGDIGRHFPDTDDAYKGISSMKLLDRVNNILAENMYSIGNADITVIAQKPKLSPYIEKMRENIADVLGIGKDLINIKATTTWIKPIEGTITSKFGQREPTTSTVPKNHTGTDIGANIGTKIKASTSGEVVLASEEGDYGKHLKIQIGEVSIIYAHCNALYVKQGDHIEQGQEIAEVGSTGNSTGPHLHFEIRISERTIDPEKILSLQ